jgi:uncharacterized repeat protein (TIGR02543 family)
VTYNGSGNTGGSVPTDSNTYASGSTVTVLANTGSLTRTPKTFSGWNTAADGSGTTYTAAQTFAISANTTLYAVWSMCTGMAGGTWITVPGNSIYGTSDFCMQKYAASDVSSVPTSQTGTAPWVNISQTTAIATCASLGTGYHLITNPEWMTIAANLANVGSNWSGAAVGSGYLRRGHSDNNPASACAADAADAADANAYVEGSCTGSSTVSGTFNQRRTSTLSNGSVVWDIGGNVYNWVNYNNSADKPTPATSVWYEYTAITGSTTTPKSHLLPLNSAQSWWTDTWNSTQSIGQIYPGTNASGGALVRGADWAVGSAAGPFAVKLHYDPSYTSTYIGFRCAWQPAVTVTYNSNGATSGSVPTESTTYSSGQGVTILGNTGTLAKTNYTFAGWNTAANGSGTTYTAAQVMTMPAWNTTLYAVWNLCGGLAAGGTWITVPGNSIYGTSDFCVQKYAPSNVGSVPTSQAGTTPWVNISQTSAISTCASLGTGYHLITNPEWMTIAANLANVGSNWSTGTVGSGSLRRGHSDNNPASACAADASDVNAYVEGSCTGSSTVSGTFTQRRTSTLSNGSVVWDIGGNVYNWVNYNNSADKPTPATGAWYEYPAITGSMTTPKSHLVPLNSAQSWWTDSWNSTQGIGQIVPGTNGSGGTFYRGGGCGNAASAGAFTVALDGSPSSANSGIGFRCAWQP